MENPDNQDPSPDTPPTDSKPQDPPKKPKTEPPQTTVDKFWDNFTTKYPGKVLTVLPKDANARTKPAKAPADSLAQTTYRSYEQARDECAKTVARIVKECRRINAKYRDPHFDIELDLKTWQRNCLNGLCEESIYSSPKGIKRVTDIFEKPQFFVDGASGTDVRQGREGDCWVMAALASLGSKQELIEKICAARDEKVGVYGFVFYRDGEWFPTIVDDKLYLASPEYNEACDEKIYWDKVKRVNSEEEYRKAYLTGSGALHFAACSDENETWLPLLEKAYAKAHGDYTAIDGGFTGEAIEDFTGGVTSAVTSTDILDRDQFWTEELLHVNKEFLFSASTGQMSDWLEPWRPDAFAVKGIVLHHAYSVMDAKEIDGKRLLKVRNPWGESEWTGAWSDGSEEWTPEWMMKLDHKFGNDGVFWISYQDFLQKYSSLDRTRLFDSSWSIKQEWTSFEIPWSTTDYLSTKFTVTVTSPEVPVVIVLNQIDTRYFHGLEGQYTFCLEFMLQKQGDGDGEYIVRTHGFWDERSVSADVTLETGTYDVLVKIRAMRNKTADTPDEVIKRLAEEKREKLVQIGMLYDQAHAKGRVIETKEEKQQREARETKTKKEERAKLREKVEKQKRKEYAKEKKLAAREKRTRKKAERAQAKREAKKAATEGAAPNAAPDDTKTEADPNGTSDNVKQEAPESSSVDSSKDSIVVVPDQPATTTTSEPQQAPPDTKAPASNDAADAPSTLTSATIAVNTSRAAALTATALNTLLDSQRPSTPAPAAAQDDDSSSIDSFRSFEFDSEIDMDSESEDGENPPDNDEENDDNKSEKGPAPCGCIGPCICTMKQQEEESKAEEEEEEKPEDPWNAVCVAGLRVYSRDSGVELKVVRAVPEEEVKEDKKETDAKEEKK